MLGESNNPTIMTQREEQVVSSKSQHQTEVQRPHTSRPFEVQKQSDKLDLSRLSNAMRDGGFPMRL